MSIFLFGYLVDFNKTGLSTARYNTPGDVWEHMMSHAMRKPIFL